MRTPKRGCSDEDAIPGGVETTLSDARRPLSNHIWRRIWTIRTSHATEPLPSSSQSPKNHFIWTRAVPPSRYLYYRGQLFEGRTDSIVASFPSTRVSLKTKVYTMSPRCQTQKSYMSPAMLYSGGYKEVVPFAYCVEQIWIPGVE
jgi:hypothetical protein